MTHEHQTTREEEAYWRLLEEKEDMLSEAARNVLSEAQSAADKAYMVSSYCFQWDLEYDWAMEKINLAAAKLTDSEHQLLAMIWRGALAAAASVDADDFESLAGYRVYSGHLHRYYRMVSSMIEGTLQAKKSDELRKELAQREPVDDLDLPF
jgi:hypothetical protein